MNCCNGNNKDPNNGGTRHKGIVSHLMMMVLCCGMPAMLLLLVPLIGSRIPGLSSIMVSITPFICPVMMLLMIGMMFIKNKNKSHEG